MRKTSGAVLGKSHSVEAFLIGVPPSQTVTALQTQRNAIWRHLQCLRAAGEKVEKATSGDQEELEPRELRCSFL